MKRIVSVVIIVLLIVGTTYTAAFASESENVALPTASAIYINSKSVEFEAYNIDGYNYFKLRDLAYALRGTDKGFDVTWDAADNSIELIPNTYYTAVGGEMVKKTQSSVNAQRTDSSIFCNGEALELSAYIIGGNNYFKLRDILSVFDIYVTWSPQTAAVYIDSFLQKEVTVSNAEEFVNAIASNTVINMKPGTYDLTPYNDQELFGFTVRDVYNLSIVGAGSGKTEFINSDRFKEILIFEDCRNISISDVKAGHTPQEYECDAGVFVFLRCLDVSVSDCYLYGCGSRGVEIIRSANITVRDTTITDCSLNAVFITDSSNVLFDNCEIVKNRAYMAVIKINSYSLHSDVTFNQCNISENHNILWTLVDTQESYESSGISLVFNDCTINGNKQIAGETPCMFQLIGGNVALNNCSIKNNDITYEYYYYAPNYSDCVITGNTFGAATLTQ